MKKVVIKFGLISGLILALCLVVSFVMIEKFDLGHSMITGYATMVLGFSVVYFGVRSYRDNTLGGVVSFGAALKAGLLISLITCVFYVVAWEIMFFGGMTSDFAKSYGESVVAELRASGASQAKIDSVTIKNKEFEVSYNNPLYNSAMTFLEPLPIALLFSFVSAGLLSRKRKLSSSESSGFAPGRR